MTRVQASKFAHLRGSTLEVTAPQLQEEGGWIGVYGHNAPLVLEIGTGKDPHLEERAARDPDRLHIGVEYSRKKLDKVIAKATRRGVENFRVLLADVVRVLDALFDPESLSQVYILFPDPWPKKRHRKKRFVQPGQIRLLCSKLAPGAQLELRTDDRDYFEQMLEVLEAEPTLENLLGPGAHSTEPRDPADHIPTLFETKFRLRGLTIHHLYYRKVPCPVTPSSES